MYNELRATVQEKVSDGVLFAATTDLWTSSCGGSEPYISFTIHYLSLERKLMAHCLETMYFPKDHTHANIIEMVKNLLNAWTIKMENIVCFTTDSGSNMKKAFEESPVEWLSCFGYNLNLAINKTMKIQRVDAARSCRKVVEAFSRSWKKKWEFQQKQKDLGDTTSQCSHSLMHDVVTRWGSTFEMLSRFLEQKEAVSSVLTADRNSRHLMPSSANINAMEDICQVFSTLHDFTDAIASEKRVTISALKPVMDHINTEILLDCDEDSALTKQMKLAVKDDLEAWYSENHL